PGRNQDSRSLPRPSPLEEGPPPPPAASLAFLPWYEVRAQVWLPPSAPRRIATPLQRGAVPGLHSWSEAPSASRHARSPCRGGLSMVSRTSVPAGLAPLGLAVLAAAGLALAAQPPAAQPPGAQPPAAAQPDAAKDPKAPGASADATLPADWVKS